MKNILAVLLFSLVFTLVPLSAYAYIGPGMGLGTIGVVLGVLFSILMALFAVLWYPIKRLLKKIKKPQPDSSRNDIEPS